MKLATKIVIGTTLITLAAVFGVLKLPLSAANDTWSFRSQLAISLATTLMNFGVSALFIISLKFYKATMRRAFITLLSGILLLAVSAAQLPIVSAFNLQNSAWYKSGVIILPILLGVLVVYLGIRGFAQLVGTRTIFIRLGIVMPVLAVISVLGIFLPRAAVTAQTSVAVLDAAQAILLWISLVEVMSALIMWQVRQHIGAHYTSAMTWFSAALAGAAVVFLGSFIGLLRAPGGINTGINPVTNVLSLLVVLVYLRAGYVFTQTEDY